MEKIIRDRIEKIEKDIVPEGYKKTTIGIIPQDWQVKKLEKFTKKMNVGFVGTCESFYVEKDKGIPMIRTGNIKDKKINLENLKYVDKEFHEKNKKSHIKKGDLLLSRHGFNGQTAIYNLNEEVNCLNIIIITPDLNIDNYFLYYQLNSDMIKREILSKTGGSTQKVVNLTDIKKLNIPIPPMEEQEKIADILTLWDEYIENMDNLIEKKEELKKGLMQKFLTGEKRLPGYAQPWKKVKLGDVSEIVMGQSPKSINYNTNNVGLPLIQGNADMKNGYTLPKIYTNEITKTCEIGDILMSVRAPVGTLAISKHKACIGRGICRIKGNKFIYYKLLNNQKEFNKYSQGSTFEAINFSTLKNIRINLPPLDEQRAIADILSKADEEIELLKELRDKKLEEKKGLMQLLLTGIIRV